MPTDEESSPPPLSSQLSLSKSSSLQTDPSSAGGLSLPVFGILRRGGGGGGIALVAGGSGFENLWKRRGGFGFGQFQFLHFRFSIVFWICYS